jgi:hypothetical protein
MRRHRCAAASVYTITVFRETANFVVVPCGAPWVVIATSSRYTF